MRLVPSPSPLSSPCPRPRRLTGCAGREPPARRRATAHHGQRHATPRARSRAPRRPRAAGRVHRHQHGQQGQRVLRLRRGRPDRRRGREHLARADPHLHVELSEPGTYQTACKPGMVGDGIRADFTVTGSAGDRAAGTDAALAAAVAELPGVRRRAGRRASLERTTEFVAAVKAGDVAKAKALYADARAPVGARSSRSRSRSATSTRRSTAARTSSRGHGVHRLPPPREGPVGRRPAEGLRRHRRPAARRRQASWSRRPRPSSSTRSSIANGSKALLDEIATGKITGEEERYSHTDLWDFDANFEGSQAAIDALRPRPQGARPGPARRPSTQRFADARRRCSTRTRPATAYVLYTALTPADLKALTVALDAVCEQVAKVAGSRGRRE